MSSSHTKPTRSRFSSPHRPSSSSASGLGDGRGGGSSDGSRSLMHRWLEPPVQSKPSFQDAGLVRGGVVENMAALGTMPKAAALKKTPSGVDGSSPAPASTVKRIVLKKPYSPAPAPAAVGAAMPVATTPSASASATATPPEITYMPLGEAAGSVEDTAEADADALLSPTSHLALPFPVLDDLDDDDYVPVPKKSKSHKGHRKSQNAGHARGHANASSPATPVHPRRQSHRHKSVRSSPAPALSTALPPAPPAPPAPAVLDPTPDPTPTPTPAPASPGRSEAMSVHELAREPDDKEQAEKIVEIAVDEALRNFHYPTAYALRLLYDEHSEESPFVAMIEDIYYQRATPKTIRKFRRLISEKKKEGKRENKGWHYFVPPSTGSQSTPRRSVPAPYDNLIKMEFASLLEDAAEDAKAKSKFQAKAQVDVDVDGHVSKKRKTEGAEQRKPPVDRADAPVDAHKDKDAHADADAPAGVAPATDGAVLHGQRNGDHHHPSLRHHSGIAKTKSPRKQKTRMASISSTSSLSSVPDDAIEDYDDFISIVDGDLGASRLESEPAEGNPAQIPAGSLRPISVEQAKPASKKQIVPPNPVSAQTTPTTHYPDERHSSMPAAVITSTTTTAATPLPNGSSGACSKLAVPKLKFQSRFGELDESVDRLIQQKLARKSETAVNTKSASGESFVRAPLVGLDELPDEPDALPQPPAPPPERGRLSRTPAPALTGRAARAAKRNHDELDDASSPTVSSFRADLEFSSARNSRAATPVNARSSKKPRGGLRVKTSCVRPMKRKGTSAGIPRGNGERPSPVGNGILYNQDDNDDSCYTCGGNGELVCCDGCTFSFHFTCIDPPMDEGQIPDDWFCNECQIRYHPPLVNENKGIFGALATNLQRKNPRSFRLPEPVREYFEGVKTGAEGEYEEIVPPKPKTSKKNAEEAFDYFKLRNGDNAVLCHQCHKGVADNRPIIPCSICGLNWHLECLDPPLAIPPILRTWRCPCHVEDLLSEMPVRLAPAHKYRKIKNMPVIEQGYSRGLANNGWIEIDEDDSEDEEADWKAQQAFGRTFRLSAKGIKRDFISRVKRDSGKSSFHPRITAPPAAAVEFKPPGPEKLQAAHILLQMAKSPSDEVQQLAQALTSRTGPAAISVAGQNVAQHIDNNSLADADIATLEAVLAQADALKQRVSKILEGRTHPVRREKSDTEHKALTPNSISHDDSTVVDELQLDNATSEDTERARNTDDVKPAADSAMNID
ncbi:hypothetical protein F4808DRAFT_81331 [Astrocystis sublimbata]|nr:hypothetical protein F4808DRAFT_81331 [Astrocystis sublimbata]